MDYNFETNEGGVVEYNIDGNFGKIAVITKKNSAIYELPVAQSSYKLRKSMTEMFTTNDSIEDQPVDIIPLMRRYIFIRVEL